MTENAAHLSDPLDRDMAALMRLSQMSLEALKRVMELQIGLASELFEKSRADAQTQAVGGGPEEFIRQRMQYAHEVSQKIVATAQAMTESTGTLRAELEQMVSEQQAVDGSAVMGFFGPILKSQSLQNGAAIEGVRRAMQEANAAFEQISQALLCQSQGTSEWISRES